MHFLWSKKIIGLTYILCPLVQDILEDAVGENEMLTGFCFKEFKF